MRKYSPETISEIKKYRKLGHTIHELMDKFSMPKTSVWYHIQGVEVNPKYKKMWIAKRGGSKVKSQERWRRAKKDAQTILKNIDAKKIMPVIMSSLYWGEGHKQNSFIFTNTDEAMIRVYLKILKTYFNIPNKNLKITLRITAQHNDRKCIEYWHKITKIPLDNIKVDKNNRNNKSRSEHGMCMIRLKNGGDMLKLTHCLIKELTKKIERV